MIDEGSAVGECLRRVTDLLTQKGKILTEYADYIKNVPDDPRLCLKVLAGDLRLLADDLVYQAGRAEELAKG